METTEAYALEIKYADELVDASIRRHARTRPVHPLEGSFQEGMDFLFRAGILPQGSDPFSEAFRQGQFDAQWSYFRLLSRRRA